MEKFHIVIGCDCDPDRKGFSKNVSNNNFIWDGIEIGIPDFAIARNKFADETGYWPKITWFVRSDPQINVISASDGFCIDKFRNIWVGLKESGDEIAWHPHLYYLDKNNSSWIQKIDDSIFTRDCLEEGFNSFKSAWGETPKTVHGGWGYQDNTTIKFYSEVGIISDCSAMPGHNTLKIGNFDNSDWTGTETKPYWISKSNYKSSAQNKSDSTGVLEIPTSMGKSLIATNLKIFRDQIKRGFYMPNKIAFTYQVPLMTLNPFINKGLIKNAIKTAINQENNYFLTYFHADEFLPSKSKSNFIKMTYSLESFMSNMKYLTDIIRERNFEPSFETLTSYTNIFKNNFD